MTDFYTKEQRKAYNLAYRSKHPKPRKPVKQLKRAYYFDKLFIRVMDWAGGIPYSDRPRLLKDARTDKSGALRSYEAILRSL